MEMGKARIAEVAETLLQPKGAHIFGDPADRLHQPVNLRPGDAEMVGDTFRLEL
jgi:hypothetical protein